MGRELISQRTEVLSWLDMRRTNVWGITRSFPRLYPTGRQIVHVLLTRLPLRELEVTRRQPDELSPLDSHSLGAPQAFVLSQDQTLRH